MSRQVFPDFQKSYQNGMNGINGMNGLNGLNGMNGNLESEMMRQEPYLSPDLFQAQIPIYYTDMTTPAPVKTQPTKFIPSINGMYKTLGFEEPYGYIQEPQMLPHLQQMDYNYQYGMQYQSRPQQPIYRTTPNPTANAYVPQETTKTAPKQNDFNKNQVKIKNIPEFVPKSNLNNPKEGELIQVQVYQSAFSNEKEKLKYGILGLAKQKSDENTEMLNSLDLRNIGIQLDKDGLANTLISPFARQQGSVSDLPNFSLPSCYAQLKPSLRNSHFQKFNEETLFYIFYFFPKDYLQALAAEELYNKNWKFCETDKHWYKNNTVWDFSQWKTVQCEQLPSNFLSNEKVLSRKVQSQ